MSSEYYQHNMVDSLGVNEGFDSGQAFFFSTQSSNGDPLVDKVYNPFKDNAGLGLRTSCLYDAYRIIRAERDSILELSPQAVAEIVRVQLDNQTKAFALRMTRVRPEDYLETKVRNGENIDDLMEPYADLVARYVVKGARPSKNEPYLYLVRALEENKTHLHNLEVDSSVDEMFEQVLEYVTAHGKEINQSAQTEELIDGHADIRLGNVAYNPLMGLLTFDCAPKKEWRETFRRENGLSMFLDLVYWNQEKAATLYVDRFNTSYEKELRGKYEQDAVESTLSVNKIIDPIVMFRRSAIMTIVGAFQHHDRLKQWGIHNMSFIASELS